MSEPVASPGRGRPLSVFEQAGGQGFFDELAEAFYAGVAGDAVLRPLYPDDLGPSTRHLALFLGQYWGGPATYSELRGHPRLRLRHAPFAIGEAERDAWLGCMRAALDAVGHRRGVAPPVLAAIADYVTGTADFLVNRR